MILILPIVFILIYINSYCTAKHLDHTAKHRVAMLIASITFLSILIFITELLSLITLLDAWNIYVLWIIVVIINLYYYYKWYSYIPIKECIPIVKIPDKTATFVFILIAIILVITLITAVVSAPNNYDSLTYHLPRVMHWIQNKSLNNYPTHIIRQLIYPPGAEMSLLHTYILGGDRYVNLVQWFSFLGCLVSVSLIISYFGYGIKVQLVGVLFTATLPMAILQSTSTQNDLVASYCFMCFIWFLLLYYKYAKWIYFILSIASICIAVFIKAHIYLWASGIIILSGIYILITYKVKVWKHIVSTIIIFLFFNINYFVRNIKLMGMPIGEGDMSVKAINEVIGVPFLTINLVRNFAIHLVLPLSKVTSYINFLVYRGVKFCHQILGVAYKDDRVFYLGDNFDASQNWIQDEDVSGNPIHVYIYVFLLLIALINIRQIKKIYIYYLGSLLLGYIIFCLYLKWMVWHSRMHLPFFISISPIVGIAIYTYFRPIYVKAIIAVLFAYSILPLFLNKNHMWLSTNNIFTIARADQYMLNNEDNTLKYRFEPYKDIIYKIKKLPKVSTIGLYIDSDTAEYPFWALLNNSSDQKYTFSHIQVNNISIKTIHEKKYPEIIVVEKSLNQRISLNLDSTKYKKLTSNELFEVFEIK